METIEERRNTNNLILHTQNITITTAHYCLMNTCTQPVCMYIPDGVKCNLLCDHPVLLDGLTDVKLVVIPKAIQIAEYVDQFLQYVIQSQKIGLVGGKLISLYRKLIKGKDNILTYGHLQCTCH